MCQLGEEKLFSMSFHVQKLILLLPKMFHLSSPPAHSVGSIVQYCLWIDNFCYDSSLLFKMTHEQLPQQLYEAQIWIEWKAFLFFFYIFCRVFLYSEFSSFLPTAPSTTSTFAFLPPCINISTQPYHVSTSCYTPSTRRYTRCEHSIMLSDMPGIRLVCEEKNLWFSLSKFFISQFKILEILGLQTTTTVEKERRAFFDDWFHDG